MNASEEASVSREKNRNHLFEDGFRYSVNDQKLLWNSIGIESLKEQPTLTSLIDCNTKLMENRIIYAMNGRVMKIRKMMGLISEYNPCPDYSNWDELFDHQIMTDQSVLQLYTFDSPITEFIHLSQDTQCELPVKAREELVDLITTIASKYNHVYYHNFAHASHVTASAVTLIDFMIIEALRNNSQTNTVKDESHGSQYNIVLDHIIPLAVCFAALVHDIEHQGVSNAQLIHEGFPLAKELKNSSVAESNSLILALDLLREERYRNLRECMFGRVDIASQSTDTSKGATLFRRCRNFVACNDERRFRQAVVSSIFSTDIFSTDRQRICKHKWMRGFGIGEFTELTKESIPADLSYYESLSKSLLGTHEPFVCRSIFDQDSLDQIRACSSLDHIIQAADVAPLFQDWNVYLLWSRNLYNELWAAHIAGRGPHVTSNWYDGQVGFYDSYILPLTQRLSASGLFGVFGNTFYENALALRSRWLQEGRSFCDSMQTHARSNIGEKS